MTPPRPVSLPGLARLVRGQHRLVQPTARLFTAFHSTAPARNKQPNSISTSDPHSIPVDQKRINASAARTPSYAGWWTEILDYHQSPQTLPDPSVLLAEDHVFQGTPAVTPTLLGSDKGKTLPTKPTVNTLPTRATNTLPTAKSRGSTVFATGTTSSLSAPAQGSYKYHGFTIPAKPTPPGAEDCCMSGCAHCIYDIYEEDRQDYKRELAKVLEALEKANIPPPPDLANKAAGNGKGNAEEDDDIDPSMKAFLELERKLKG